MLKLRFDRYIKLYHVGICGKQHKPPLVNYAYDSSMENSKFNVSDAAVSSPEFLIKGLKECFELPRVKLYRNDLKGNKN